MLYSDGGARGSLPAAIAFVALKAGETVKADAT
jgi:hypothetical protein